VSSSPPLKYQDEFRRLERERGSYARDCGQAINGRVQYACLMWLMFETITKAISALGFASLPTLEVKRATFGWRNIERTRLVLLVWMNFTNNGGKPFLKWRRA